MAYVINKFNGEQLVVLQDGTLDTSTSVGLLGRNYVGYGEIQNENFIFLLENFANDTAPSRPVPGQIWFNTSENKAFVYDGDQWGVIGAAEQNAVAPIAAATGALWLKTPANQLFVYTGTEWQLIGPETVEGFGSTKVRSTTLIDTVGVSRPVLILETNAVPLAICTSEAFTIALSNLVPGFNDALVSGINLSNTGQLKGNITGNAVTATQLLTPRLINGVPFSGTTNITVQAAAPFPIIRGTHLIGQDYNGSVERSWSVDATANNIVGKIVARDSAGDFSAGTITANVVGSLVGNVTAGTGTSVFNVVQANQFIGATLSGNASSTTRLATVRTINGVGFDGTSNITVTAAASTLTGSVLATNVTESSLTQVGILNSLNVANDINIGSSGQAKLFVDAGIPTIRSSAGALNFDMGASGPDISFVTAATSLALGGPSAPAILGDNTTNLGIVGHKFNNVFANVFHGLSTSAQYADLAENYIADDQYEPGTVLEFAGKKEVTIASEETLRVAGVVSTNPAYLMNSDRGDLLVLGDFVVAVALQGRVPCKVRGTIHKGDMLISAGNGYAKSTHTPLLGAVIGKALEDFATQSDTSNQETDLVGIIEVVVGRM